MLIEYKQPLNEKFVLCLGLFDALHLGHKKLINEALIISKRENLPLCVFTLKGNIENIKGNSLLYSFEDRAIRLFELGVNYIIYAEMNDEFMNTEHNVFINELLKAYKTKHIVFGSDFTYGRNKRGNCETLISYLTDVKIDYTMVNLMQLNGNKISSNAIRDLLINGNIEIANNLLGENYSITGTVVSGRKIGNKLGFPTMNIELKNNIIHLKYGVYITKTLIDGKLYKSITNIGSHPTFQDYSCNVETYVLDYSGNLYNKKIKVIFYEFLRDIKKFSCENELTEQLILDKNYALIKNY